MSFSLRCITLLITAIVGILLIVALDQFQISTWREARQLELNTAADLISFRLENSLISRINAARYLGAAVEARGTFQEAEFVRFASNVMEYNPSLRALQLTNEETRVVYVYPPRNNMITITDPMLLIEDPLRGRYVRRAITEKQLTVQPPFELRQGGTGIVARKPIFSSGEFRALAIAVLDVPVIIEEAFPELYESDYRLSLIDSRGTTFYNAFEEGVHFSERSVSFADTQWTMRIAPAEGARQAPVLPRLIVYGLGGALLILLLLLIALLSGRAEQLEEEVARRTAELKQNEERFRIVADYTADWEYWILPDGTLEYVSPSVEDLTGYPAAELRTGEDVLKKLVHPEDRRELEEHLLAEKEILNTPQEIVYFRIGTKDGEERWIGHLCRAVYNSEGVFLGRRASNRDITEHKAVAENLQHMVEQKELLMKELNHRIKNNLAMITSLVQLKSSSLGDSVDLSDIVHQIDTIRIVHEKLYQTSRINRIDMDDYIGDLLSRVFSFSDVEVHIENEVQVDQIASGAAIPIGLIINEVATNAIKYSFTPEESARFTVEMSRDDESGEYVLSLSHSGSPFPEEIDFDNTETLGLRLIRELATQLDGSVELTKRPSPRYLLRFPVTAAA